MNLSPNRPGPGFRAPTPHAVIINRGAASTQYLVFTSFSLEFWEDME